MGDLRAGASLILCALAADGSSTISGVHHVRRGYEDIERKLLDIGAHIVPSTAGEGPGTP
jgi:UDP-N-acetylglucosamine 1-carboxyvinyltransferase